MTHPARIDAAISLELPFEVPPLLAAGAELKSSFCLASGRQAYLGGPVGRLDTYENLCAFEAAIAGAERAIGIRPQFFVHDLHPDFLASRTAIERAAREGRPAIAVQHHHAHIAACLADNGRPDRTGAEGIAIGLAFDGTGLGPDGSIWGGEFLLADYSHCERAAHLRTLPLPGGDLAVRQPWRMALAALWRCGLPWEGWLAPVQAADELQRTVLRRQLETGLNTAETSSLGRLFDAAAALAGVRQVCEHEAQAAMDFEALADPAEGGAYPFDCSSTSAAGARIADPAPLFAALLGDLDRRVPPPVISARFHNGVAGMALEICASLSASSGLRTAALSGGVWQNRILLRRTVTLLESAGFEVLLPRRVPAHDGGLAFGQAVVAASLVETGGNKKEEQTA